MHKVLIRIKMLFGKLKIYTIVQCNLLKYMRIFQIWKAPEATG